MGVFKNDVGRPKNKTILIRNILRGILVILLAAAIFVSISFTNKDNKKEDKTTTSKTKVVTTTVTTTAVTKTKRVFNNIAEEVYSYYENFTFAPPLDEFYTEKGALQANLPENYMVTIATSNVEKIKCKGDHNKYIEDEMCYEENDILNMVEKLFDKKITFNSNTSISVDCNGYEYSPEYKEFYEGGGLGTTEEYIKAMYDYKIEDKTLYIYEVVGEYGFANNVYFLASGKEVEGELTKEKLLSDKDLFDKYKWTFIKNDKGNYIYKSVEKIK